MLEVSADNPDTVIGDDQQYFPAQLTASTSKLGLSTAVHSAIILAIV